MNLNNKSGRGTFKMAICERAKVAAFQWCDSKVVNVVSSYMDFRVASAPRRVGSERNQVQCPGAIVHYQNYMGGVDKGDQIRSHFGGFASQSHFKKWYKKTVMALLDFMLLNAWKLWMSCERIEERETLERYEFLQCVAHELLHYKKESLMSPKKGAGRLENEDDTNQQGTTIRHEFVEPERKRQRCIVCGLETTMYEKRKEKLGNNVSDEFKKKVNDSYQGTRRNVLHCKQCNTSAHNFIMKKDRKFIHGLFENMTCMEILHSSIGTEIWNVGKVGNKRNSVNSRHPIVREVKACVDAHLNID